MSATTIFVIGVIAAGLLAAVAVFLVAYRRSPSEGPITGQLDRAAIRQDRLARKERVSAAPETSQVAVLDRHTSVIDDEALVAPPDPLLEREEVSKSEYGVTRRQFFNRSLLGIFGIFLAQFAIGGLAFLWPKLKGGFGTPINAGNIDALRAEIIQGDGTIIPLFLSAAQSWIVPIDASVIPGSSFDGTPAPVVVGAGEEPGLMALWQRCVHLGCRVPSCIPSQGFECPCHGSKYNFHGEYSQGPAPRNMDRFEVLLDEAGNLIIDTGTVVQTSRAKVQTIAYPQGPFCV